MVNQWLVPKCMHCNHGIMKMVRSTLLITDTQVWATYRCMNPLCNFVVRICLYDSNREEELEDWQYDISSEYCEVEQVNET